MKYFLDTTELLKNCQNNDYRFNDDWVILDKTLMECKENGTKNFINYLNRLEESGTIKIEKYNFDSAAHKLKYVVNNYSKLISLYNLNGLGDVYLFAYILSEKEQSTLFSNNNHAVITSDNPLEGSMKKENIKCFTLSEYYQHKNTNEELDSKTPTTIQNFKKNTNSKRGKIKSENTIKIKLPNKP